MIKRSINENLNKFTKIIAITVIVVLLVGLSACGNRSLNSIVIAGSTSVQPYAEVLAEEYEKIYQGYETDIQGGGSAAGITAAESGTAEIGMSSRDLNEKEMSLWSIEIAKDGLAIIIHPDNTIADLSIEQVRDIYSAKCTDWSQLGGHAAKIHIIAREEGSGTRSAFENLVMGSDKITPKAIVQDSNGAVRQLVSDDINSIGFISLGLVDQTVKSLTLEGVAPTRENVIDGSYSLYRPFIFVVNGEPEGLTKKFIDFTLSPEGQLILTHEGLISTTERAG